MPDIMGPVKGVYYDLLIEVYQAVDTSARM